MKSRAAIGDHPIHPVLITVPIGAFVLALIADIATSVTGDHFWYQFSFSCIGIGILAALLAAIFGFIDYFGVKMSAQGAKLATIHMLLNLGAVLLYVIDFFLRRNNAGFQTGRWPMVMALEIIALIVLGTSGWLGGQMTFVHKVGVIENADLEATDIGRRDHAA
jgi:uncharacterized membrane protein